MAQSNYKIAAIIVFFGKWPKWIDQYIVSCIYNPHIQFIVLSDYQLPKRFKNIEWKHFTESDFLKLVKQKLGVESKSFTPKKLCDFKPCYGVLFEELLKDYDFWAFCDIDLVFGNLVNEGVNKLLEGNDVISFYDGFVSGPFCLLRNKPQINNLFKEVKSYKTVLEHPKHLCFDEHIVKERNRKITVFKLVNFVRFSIGYIFSKKNFPKKIAQLRFEFQWYIKKKTVTSPIDFTEVVLKLTAQGKVRGKFEKLIINDTDYIRSGLHNWEIIFRDGNIIDMSGRELPVFHFLESKKNSGQFQVEDMPGTQEFRINAHGIRQV